MFSFGGRENFDRGAADTTENVLDVLSRAGVSILWRDNNSSSKGVADRVTFEDFRSPQVNPECDVECRDVGMLHDLQAYIDAQDGDILIVLHQMGNHGPAYYKRYPKDFEKFMPVCESEELSLCTDEQIGNSYDNAILYTDYFLAQVIALLKANTPRFETAMLYIGDHGESLGENGLYQHGMPYVLAPHEQTAVPMIVWAGESSDVDLGGSLTLRNTLNDHDALAPSLLALFEIASQEMPEKQPLLLAFKHDTD
jgi:lipid A ethanolaminephosphotransferase